MNWVQRIGLGLVCGWLLGCASLQGPPFDQTALDQAVAARDKAMALVTTATEPYAQHEADVTALRAQVEAAAAYAASRPHNEVTTKQWQVMSDPDANLLGGFLKRWQSLGKLNPGFALEAGRSIGEGFDKIIELEQARKH